MQPRQSTTIEPHPAQVLQPLSPSGKQEASSDQSTPPSPWEKSSIDGGEYLCIRDIDEMPPFLMSVSSDTDLWLFIGSNGGFSAGRVDPDHALFPYRPADRILSQPGAAGVGSHFLVDGECWDPWSEESPHQLTRNLYKHVAGTSVIFEEINHTLQLILRWRMQPSEAYGLVRSCELVNIGERPRSIRMLDGWHHMLPHGVADNVYSRFSYLAAGYMRHELDQESGLGIYTLNSGISDRAEPCESLRVSCAWCIGFDQPQILLSDRQIDSFRHGRELLPELEVRGEFGAHLIAVDFELGADQSRRWTLGADIGLDHAAVVSLRKQLRNPEDFARILEADADQNTLALKRRVAAADGLQQTASRQASVHHFANVMFNCMRGGTLNDGYNFSRQDFLSYLKSRNPGVRKRHSEWLGKLPDLSTTQALQLSAADQSDPQLERLAREYLPLCFSRRHGDPSRPWNRFEIRTKDSNGNPVFGYAGNWRDIFQNWESLAYSYPSCFRSMISVFLNASTADGYNPYRITREGIDWEIMDPKDPWSHIGYWGDHQIIYLLRLLEGEEKFWPGRLADSLNERIHSYASVPYRILGFDSMLADPRHSIDFDEEAHEALLERSKRLGADGRLVMDDNEEVLLVSLGEKLLLPLLVKLTNLVPGGGIWMNTQRPEWNDANNALAGWGLSVVTVCYIRRYLSFLQGLMENCGEESIEVSEPVGTMLAQLNTALGEITPGASGEEQLRVITALGRIGEQHREKVYSGDVFETQRIPLQQILDFLATALNVVDQTVSSNRREDGMFHSYNLLEISHGKAEIRTLGVMLEGQVAALSSGLLDHQQATTLLKELRQSQLYRQDQNSYLLYPDREITPFLQRNILPEGWQSKAPVLEALTKAGDCHLVVLDDLGDVHFNGDLKNQRELRELLDRLAREPEWSSAIERDREPILKLWEEVFRHHEFTGRSGTMFAFEGLGSIYWHMIAKLLLAVQEIHSETQVPSGEASELAVIYESVRNGLGFTKGPENYGAFPTDPYSHTPRHRGAQQPGMTGQVKEEILTRMTELGVKIIDGQIQFDPKLLQRHEFFTEAHRFESIDFSGTPQQWELGANTLAFTLFQTPVCYHLGSTPSITAETSDGESLTFEGTKLPLKESRSLFERSGQIRRLTVTIPEQRLSTL